MVKVAVAGGSGNVARELIEGILAAKRHQIMVLTRNKPDEHKRDGVQWVQADYHNKAALVEVLAGVDVVLSFVLPYSDNEDIAQKTLIDACIAAGVKRASDSGISVYAGKDRVRQYLEAVNREKKVLEYTLFQPGLFLNYFTYPYPSSKHLVMSAHYIDFETRQAILIDDGQQPVTFTVAQGMAAVVATALDYPREWPRDGGMQGWQTTSAELVRLGESIRGGPFTIYRVTQADLEANGLQTPWCPIIEHPAIPKD